MHSHCNSTSLVGMHLVRTPASPSEAGVPSLMPHRRYLLGLCKYTSREEYSVQYLQHPVHILDLSLSIACESINPTTGPPNCTPPPFKNLTAPKLPRSNNAAVISNQCTAAGTVRSGGRNCVDVQTPSKREDMLLRPGRQEGFESGFLLCCTIIILSPLACCLSFITS